MRVTLLLTMVVGLVALSIDMFLPSLPTIAVQFGCAPATAQLTVTLFLGAFAATQLLCGPISDRYGRRIVMLGGLSLYTAAGLACAAAPSIEFLIVARILQAFGGGSGLVVARAIARDLYEGDRLARVMSHLGVATAVNPIVAPIIGGYLHDAFGWRAVFLVLGGFGIVLTFLAALIPETNRAPDASALRPGQLARNLGQLLGSRTYRAYTMVNMLMFGGQFAFISASSFVLITIVGVTPRLYGLCFAGVAAGLMMGNLCSGWFGKQVGLDRMISGGTALGALAGVVMAALAFGGVLTAASVVFPMCAFALGVGMTLPNGVAGAMGPFPEKAGLAAAGAGFLQMTGAAIYSIGLGGLHDGTARPMTAGIGLAGLSALLLFRWLGPRRVRMPAG